MRGLFGTDGVRGIPGQFPLDQSTVSRLAAALAEHLGQRQRRRRILLAGDTRASTPLLASWFAGAFMAQGGEVVWAGVLPTPAVSQLLRARQDFAAGVVISASHNPAQDNGLKFMAATGEKLSQEEEAHIEALAQTLPAQKREELPAENPGLRQEYLKLLLTTLPAGALAGLKVVLDTANGATAPVAKEFFAACGAEVQVIHDQPDGTNINRQCGALHPQGLASFLRERGAHAGVAFDGDGDRAVLVTHRGRVLNGDDVLLLWARSLREQGQLPKDTVVATVMSNAALEVALQKEGMRLVRCPVGDREVWETMRREGAALGGEQSGHVICAHYGVTGDGLLTAAHLLAQSAQSGKSLEERADLQPFPQVLLGVRVSEKKPLESLSELAKTIAQAESQLHGQGRVLVRYSGTENLLRVMVEAASQQLAQDLAGHIAQVAERLLA